MQLGLVRLSSSFCGPVLTDLEHCARMAHPAARGAILESTELRTTRTDEVAQGCRRHRKNDGRSQTHRAPESAGADLHGDNSVCVGQNARCWAHVYTFCYCADDSKIDPKWLFWARPRLQEIEAKFAQPDYPEMRHQRLQAMVKVAIRFSDEHYATTISSRYSISEDSENLRLQFDALWSIFPPNVLVTGADRYLSHSRVWRVIHASYRPATPLEGESFGVLVSFEEWNGLEYGSTVEVKKIKAYSGARPLDELSIMPLHLKRDRASICSNILSRSARQMALHGFQNKLQEYSSNGIVLNREKEPWVLEKFHVRT